MIKTNTPSPGLVHRIIDATQWLDAPERGRILERINRDKGIISDDFRKDIIKAFRRRVAQEGGVAALQAQLRGQNIVLHDLADEVGRLEHIADDETDPRQVAFEDDARAQQQEVLSRFTHEMNDVGRRVDRRVEQGARSTTDNEAMARLYQTLNATPKKPAANDGFPEFTKN